MAHKPKPGTRHSTRELCESYPLAGPPGRDLVEVDAVPEQVARWLLEHGFTGEDRRGVKWVDGKEVKSVKPDTDTNTGTGARAPGAVTVPAEDAAAIRSGVVSSLPPAVAKQVTKRPRLAAKLQDAALTVAAKAWLKVNEWSEPAMKVAAVLSDVLDTPADMKKFGYNPTAAGGQQNAALANNDFVRMNLEATLGVGVSGHLAASVASQVLSRALLYAKKRVSGMRMESESGADGLGEVAALVAEVLTEVNAALGLRGSPTAERVAAALGTLLKGA